MDKVERDDGNMREAVKLRSMLERDTKKRELSG